MAEFYMRVRDLPYRRQVPVETLYKRRQMAGGWMFPLPIIEKLPAWLQSIALGQAAWKPLALGILLILTFAALRLVFRWAHRGPRHHHRPEALNSPGF